MGYLTRLKHCADVGFKACADTRFSLLRRIEHHLVQRNEITDDPLNDLFSRWRYAIAKNDFQRLCGTKAQFMRTVNRELDFGVRPNKILRCPNVATALNSIL